MPVSKDDPDVLVIGAGIVGLFCAYYLRLAGRSVTVVDRGQVGGTQSCSYGNTGFVGTQGATPLAEPGVLAHGMRWLLNPESPFYIKPRADPELARWLWRFRRACNERDAAAGFEILVELKKRSLDTFRELCADEASYSEQGMLVVFRTARGFEQASKTVPQAVAHGVPLRQVTRDELRELEPDAEFDVHGALLNEQGAALIVPEFLTWLAGQLAGLGVEIHENAEVLRFRSANRTVRQVRTRLGDFNPGEVVIAAGAWSAACARLLGVRLSLQPAKGYSVTVKAPGNGPRRPTLLGEGKVALAPLGDRLRFGGTLELSGMDAAISQRRLDGIVRTVHDFLPALERTPVIETWSGFRPCTPDGLPYIGRARDHRNLSVACGHGHIGLGLAPASGSLLAQIVCRERPDMDITPFRVDRYRS